jgi:hypothetical protein
MHFRAYILAQWTRIHLKLHYDIVGNELHLVKMNWFFVKYEGIELLACPGWNSRDCICGWGGGGNLLATMPTTIESDSLLPPLTIAWLLTMGLSMLAKCGYNLLCFFCCCHCCSFQVVYQFSPVGCAIVFATPPMTKQYLVNSWLYKIRVSVCAYT